MPVNEVAAPDVDEAFTRALEQDAAAAPAYPAPPRIAVSADPDAPHGRAEDGTPLAPHGRNKKTGRPNLKPAGPGRGRHAADQPRTTEAPREGTVIKPGAGPDYREDLTGLAMTIWLAGSAMHGGKLWILPVPDTRPYAAVWYDQMPAMVTAWDQAARKNARVRGYVEKLSGEGSWAWVFGVTVTSMSFITGCAELARKDTPETKGARAEARARAAQLNDLKLGEFMEAQIAAMGLEQASEAQEAA
jgi:hypothetical protein